MFCLSEYTLVDCKRIQKKMTSLIDEILAMRGRIPVTIRGQLARYGIHLRADFFEPRPRRPRCTATVRSGHQCTRACHGDFAMCRMHHTQQSRPVRQTCSETTKKGTPCKCKAYKSLSICFSHAKKAGILPEVPSECPICSCELTNENRTKTVCGHHFCTGCLSHWASSKGSPRRQGKRFVNQVSCPMCRKSIQVLRGPYWYVYGGKAPTQQTSGTEWMTRLDIVPTTPLQRDMVLENARALGQFLLTEFNVSGTAMTDFVFDSVLGGLGFVRQRNPPE